MVHCFCQYQHIVPFRIYPFGLQNMKFSHFSMVIHFPAILILIPVTGASWLLGWNLVSHAWLPSLTNMCRFLPPVKVSGHSIHLDSTSCICPGGALLVRSYHAGPPISNQPSEHPPHWSITFTT